MFSHKSPRVNFHHSPVSKGQSSIPLVQWDDDKVSVSDESEVNRNWRALQGKSNDNNSDKDGIVDGEDNDFKKLALELHKEEGLGEAVQKLWQIFLKQFGKIPSHKKLKGEIKIYITTKNS